MRSLALVSLVVAALAVSSAAAAPPAADLYTPFDKSLDTYVRDGDVYYRALLIERPNFDRFATALDLSPATLASWSKPYHLAFSINSRSLSRLTAPLLL